MLYDKDQRDINLRNINNLSNQISSEIKNVSIVQKYTTQGKAILKSLPVSALKQLVSDRSEYHFGKESIINKALSYKKTTSGLKQTVQDISNRDNLSLNKLSTLTRGYLINVEASPDSEGLDVIATDNAKDYIESLIKDKENPTPNPDKVMFSSNVKIHNNKLVPLNNKGKHEVSQNNLDKAWKLAKEINSKYAQGSPSHKSLHKIASKKPTKNEEVLAIDMMDKLFQEMTVKFNITKVGTYGVGLTTITSLAYYSPDDPYFDFAWIQKLVDCNLIYISRIFSHNGFKYILVKINGNGRQFIQEFIHRDNQSPSLNGYTLTKIYEALSSEDTSINLSKLPEIIIDKE